MVSYVYALPFGQGKHFLSNLSGVSNALLGGFEFSGVVHMNSGSPATPQLSVDNTQNELLPGAYSEVHFKLPEGATSESYKVPANVLLVRSDCMHVATVGDKGQVVLKEVTIGRDYGSDIEIIQGLAADDKVILSPPDSLTDGVNVHVAPPPPGKVAKS